MKKFYLLLLSAFIAGQVMAQSATITTNSSDKIANNKKETVATSVASQSATSNVKQPNTQLSELPGFPSYMNTGNPELDNANYATAKENWIKENQEVYNTYLTSLSGTNNTSGNTINYKDLPGFPQYINTGDEAADKANYIAAKKKWFNENQELINNTNNK